MTAGKPRPDLAEQLAKHREEFAFAVAHGLSLDRARAILARRRWQKLLADHGRTAEAPMPPVGGKQIPHQWWMDL